MAGLIVLDMVFPLKLALAAGLTGSIVRMNQRTRAPNGRQRVNVVQSRSMHTYQFGTVPVKFEIWQEIDTCFEVTDAGAKGFLLEDPKDLNVQTGLLYPYTTAVLGTIGLGYGVPSYRLYKRYTALGGVYTTDRYISRPQATPVLRRGSSVVAYGGSAGNVAIDYTTGLATFVADTSQNLSSITPGAGTILNFANGTGIVAAMSIGQRVYLSGFTGTAASALNGTSHAIVAKGATSLSVSTNTTGLSATGGTAFKYPQASETLTWTGKMYVPVHFINDNFDWSMVRPGSLEGNRLFIGPQVALEEVWE